MIVGNGMIASEFNLHSEDYVDYLIFASGVSNSKEINKNEFDREKKIILEIINKYKRLKLIYFSSILVEISKNKYYTAKLEIEELIKTYAANYIIFRLPQIIGNRGNSNNLVNFLKHSINNDLEIIVYNDVERALIDIEDLVMVVNYCKNKINHEILNFSGIEKLNVIILCNLIGNILNKKPILKITNDVENNNWNTKNSDIVNEAIVKINNVEYTNRVLRKYIKNESNNIKFCI